MVLYARATTEPASLTAAVRREVQSIEPNLPLPDMQTVAETMAGSLYLPRMGAMLLAAFAGLALTLAAIGVYGVTAFSVAQRTHEIGVRMALGARSDDVLGLVLKEGLRLAGVGVVLGLALSFVVARSLEGFLYGVSGRDAVTFASVPLVLGAVAFAACLVPARRAMKMELLEALRYR
jgi:putative ABC transport system permease protein